MLRFLLLMGYLVFSTYVSCDYSDYPEVQESYEFYRTPQKWFDAMNTCRRDDATLAMPKNEAEVAVLKKIFEAYPASILNVSNPKYIFLGFHDMFRKWEFVTDTGIPLQYFYHKWEKNEPNNYRGKENCVTLSRSGLLSDNACDISLVFICQKNKDKIKNSKDIKYITEDTAYKYFNISNKYYKLHLNPRIWSEARAICQAEGGNLAIINNRAEEEFLVAMFNEPENSLKYVTSFDYALLGFHDLFRERYFYTVKGDELQSTGYTNWKSGEPNNRGGHEDCGAMHLSGGLNDFSCDVAAVFFCEIDVGSKLSSMLDVRLSNK